MNQTNFLSRFRVVNMDPQPMMHLNHFERHNPFNRRTPSDADDYVVLIVIIVKTISRAERFIRNFALFKFGCNFIIIIYFEPSQEILVAPNSPWVG